MQKTLGILSTLLLGVGITAHHRHGAGHQRGGLGGTGNPRESNGRFGEGRQFKQAKRQQKVLPPAESEAPAETFSARIYTQLPDTPEGIGVDSQGNLYASLFNTGEIVQLKEDGQYVHIAWVPTEADSGQGPRPWPCPGQR